MFLLRWQGCDIRPLVTFCKTLFTGNGVKSYVLFWTTTPWTLPANEAVCYGSNIKYVPFCTEHFTSIQIIVCM